MSWRSALALAIGVFLVTVLARLPARLVAVWLPAPLACEAPTGTLWQGACTQLRDNALTLADVRWTLHPGELLALRLSADLACDDPRALGRARVTLRPDGELRIRALSAQLPLADGLPMLPSGLAGTVQLDVSDVRIRHQQLLALAGSVRVLQLRSESQSADLGSFELQFPPAPQGSPIRGQLRDLGGPLAVDGQLQLMRGGGYDLSGSVTARAQATPALLQALQLLGPADTSGRRTFSLAGSL